MNFGEGKTVKSRKAHRCEWCFESIPAGSPAYHYHGMWEGDWQNWYMHPECLRDYIMDDFDDGFTPGQGTRPKDADRVGQA